MRNEPKLRITHEAAKQLEKKPPIIKEAEKVRMEERAKKREFQEQLRHKRKEAFQAAKQADLDLHAACDEDDAAMKVQGEDQKKLHALKTSANGFKIEAEELDKKITRFPVPTSLDRVFAESPPACSPGAGET